MVFYEFGENSAFQKEWTFAVHIHPTSHLIRWNCTGCGRAANHPAGSFDVTVEGGRSFPDFLGCGAYPFLIVSERVLDILKGAAIKCFQEYPVRIAAVEDSGLRCEDAPLYFRLEIAGECMIDFGRSGAEIESVCSQCAAITLNVPYIKHFSLIDGSWDGSPLFRDRRYFPNVTFCTQDTKRLAGANRFTNVRFQQMG